MHCMQATLFGHWLLFAACFVCLRSFVPVALVHAWLHGSQLQASMIDIRTDMPGCVHSHRHMSCAYSVDAVHRLAVLWTSVGRCCIGRCLCVLASTTLAVCLVMSGVTHLVCMLLCVQSPMHVAFGCCRVRAQTGCIFLCHRTKLSGKMLALVSFCDCCMSRMHSQAAIL
jgi:hypothetical protein